MRRLATTAAVALSCLAGLAASPQDAGPSDPGPLKRLESPEGGWEVRLPGRASREVELAAEDAITAGTPERAKLIFRARLSRPWQGPVRLSFHVQNRQGWYYQTANLAVVPHGRWRDIEIDFSPQSAAWEAVGHGRPWDELSARGIFRAGVRLFSELPYQGALEVGGIAWAPSPPPPAGTPEILDLREPAADRRGAVRAGELWELAFRIPGPVFRPFDPGEADLFCDILTPDGSVKRVTAFYYQEYMPAVDRPQAPATAASDGDMMGGGPVPIGRPTWRVRYRPGIAGLYRYRVFVKLAGHREAEGGAPAAEGWFTVSGTADSGVAPRAPAAPGEVWPPDGEFVLSVARGPGTEWRPELASHPAVWREGAFRREYTSFPGRLWRVMLEWTRRWRRWEGLGSYDLALAWRFDQMVREAERRRVALPCAILDDATFLEHGTYRWPVNPLARGEGGPLVGPGEFFASEEARHCFLMRARYMIARWGHSPAISSWCMASGLPASGVAEWHAKVARALARLDPERGRGVVSLHPFALPFRKSRELGEFEKGRRTGWQLDREDSPKGRLARARQRGERGGDALELFFPPPPPVPVKTRPGGTEDGYPDPAEGLPEFKWVTLSRPLDDNLFEYDYLTFDVRMAEDSAGVGRAQVIMRDRDLLWYDCLLETPLRAGDWTRVVLDLTTPEGHMRAVGHARPWTAWTRTRIRKIGIRVFPNGPAPAPALIDHVKLQAVDRPPRPLDVKVVRAGPDSVGRFQKHEIVLDIGRDFPNPFDPGAVAVDGIFRHESGRRTVVPGFFYEPHSRRLERKEVDGIKREVEILRVTGAPDWRIRFAPTELGRYKVTIRVRTPTETIERPAGGFRCAKSERRGFIRVAKDGRYFEHSTGEIFYPLGPVIRSPTDTRDITRDPSIRKQAEAAGFRGTYQFDEYLRALSGGGANWIRMWMCSWWCGLEWYRKWPGYGGAGWYNMPNAWRLDHVIEAAERHGVYVQLCLQNHGQTSQRIDHEWEYHPYNRYEPEAFPGRHDKHPKQGIQPLLRTGRFLRPGGWLVNAAQFYSDARARRLKQNLYRYIVARWGYSTNVFSWVLSSEVEFTGEYEKVQSRRDDHDLYHDWSFKGADYARHTRDYHRAMARYLKKVDPWGHLVTTHFSHPYRGRAIWRLKEMDYSQSNAYSGYARWKVFTGPMGPGTPGTCVAVPFAMDQYISRFLGHYDKPVIIGEWGGYWMANSIEFLDAELHTGTWASIMTPMAGSTGFWWWTHVHFRDRYGVFGAVKRFLEGEDRRGLRLRKTRVQLKDGSGEPIPDVCGLALGNRTQADVYVYHLEQTKELRSAPEVKDVTLVLPGLAEGRYVVEPWYTEEGKPTGRRAMVTVPPDGEFRYDFDTPLKGDIAVKVRPLE